MTPLEAALLELAIEGVRQAIASGNVTPEEVQRRIGQKHAEADAAEDRMNNRIGDDQ